jgi:type I restriction-modification system DNA methylase subunit
MSTVNMDQQYKDVAWRLFNLCRGHYTAFNFIGVLGFYIALVKQGRYDFSYDDNLDENIQVELDTVNRIRIKDVSNTPIRPELMREIIHTITYIDDYAKLFELIILEQTSPAGRFEGVFIQPKEITHFITSFIKERKIQSAYNPFAGIASYQIDNRDTRFYSQEINHEAWIIGKIRLLLNDIDSTNYVCEDSTENWQRIKFDAVISTPPFGVRINHNRYYYTNGQHYAHKEYDSFYIVYALNSITSNGIVVSVVPLGFLFKSGSLAQEFRQHILNSGYVQKVILLPDNIFYNTAIKCAVVILTKNQNKGVVMVDGSTFFEIAGRQNVLKNEELLEAIENFDSRCVKHISNEEIAANDFNLNPAIYVNTVSDVIEVPDGFELKKLRDVISAYKGDKVENLNARFVRGKDLADGRFSFDKTFEDLQIESISQRCTLLGKDLLLVLKIGNLKPTYFHHLSNIDVCCNPNVLTFDFNDGIYPQYLVNELGKDYIIKQVATRSGVGVMPSITLNNLLEVEVLIPDFQTQKILFENDKQNDTLLKAKELGLEDLANRQKNDFIEEVRIKKHNLAQYLAEINSSISALSKYIDNRGIGDELISQRMQISLSNHISKLFVSIEEMNKKLEFLTRETTFGESKSVDINKLLRSFKGTSLYSIDYIFDKEAIQSKVALVDIAEEDFKEVIRQIISNAVKHGFVTDASNHIIRINLTYDMTDNMYVLSISNNGKPMPKGMDNKRYGIKGEVAGVTGNEGIGGYRVKSIIEHYKGSYSIENYPEKLFPVEINIKLPKYE